MMILVSYDGSADAPAAINRVAQLAPGAKARVLTVRPAVIELMARTGSGVAQDRNHSVLVVPSASLIARRQHQLDRDVAPV